MPMAAMAMLLEVFSFGDVVVVMAIIELTMSSPSDLV